MSRYISVAALTPRNIPAYYVIDTATGQRVRAYDCELWADHKAKALNHSARRRQPINDSGGYRWTERLMQRHTAPHSTPEQWKTGGICE